MHFTQENNTEIFMNLIMKVIMYLILSISLILLSACGKSEEEKQIEAIEKQDKQQQAQAQKQEQQKFENVGACVKTKMTEAGLSADTKPTIEILQQCLSLTKQ